MRACLILFCAVLGSASVAQFATFKQQYNKTYATTEEHDHRFGLFQTNLQMYEHRNRYFGANYGVDEFSDLSMTEFLAQQAGCYSPEKTPDQLSGGSDYTPEQLAAYRKVIDAADQSIDWRDDKHMAVTPAKNQGAFGDCWAFGASGTLEGINVAQAKNKLVSLCEQEFIDCCAECNGAGPGLSWQWLINNTKGYLDTEASYPYKGDKPKGQCRPATAVVSTAKVSSWKIINQAKDGNQDPFLAEMMTMGPCNIGVDASCLSGYKDGVISNCTGKDVDHANLIVGSGVTPASENSIPYFIVKNSWGDGWVMEGFYKVARNTGQMKIDACWHAYV